MGLAGGYLSTYRGYTLDPFQQEAIACLQRGESVLVSAPTGTGKTLIADYLTAEVYRQGGQVVYTAPIKALSNQKFKEFKALLGEESVGILTGDVVQNPSAAVLIMTTEIFRNLLLTDPQRLAHTRYVIFDEIHYIDDPTRGSVWEESLIFMPTWMRFLGLSATIPNVDELARWISQIHGREVRVVQHRERAVPLEHRLFERSLGVCTRRQLENRYRRYAARFGTTQTGAIAATFEPTRHIDLVRHLGRELLPCLFFTFSRRRCESNAQELAEHFSYLEPARRHEVEEVVTRTLARYDGAGERSVRAMEPLLMQGIAYHHAGMLPAAKDVVEELFERRLIYVLYCTETFAVGLNFPCRTVCFESLNKWDGKNFRPLTNREYFQMAGRAGRRGIDERGYVYTAVDFNFFRPGEMPSMREEDVEPLQSRFTLSYNTVLNLVRMYDEAEIESVLSRNFARFQADEARQRIAAERTALEKEQNAVLGALPPAEANQLLAYIERARALDQLYERINKMQRSGDFHGIKELRRQAKSLRRHLARLERQGIGEKARAHRRQLAQYRRISQRLAALAEELARLPSPDSFMEEFLQKRSLLEAMDYIRDGELTARGSFAAEINGSELLITELFFAGVFHDWGEDEINALAACIDYEPRRGEERPRHNAFDTAAVHKAVAFIAQFERSYLGYSELEFNDHLAPAARLWSEGASFADVLAVAGVDEGDIVFAFRRAIDVVRQVRQAARQDEYIAAKLSRCIGKMDRDEVSILL